jgi:hypothetical protein
VWGQWPAGAQFISLRRGDLTWPIARKNAYASSLENSPGRAASSAARAVAYPRSSLGGAFKSVLIHATLNLSYSGEISSGTGVARSPAPAAGPARAASRVGRRNALPLDGFFGPGCSAWNQRAKARGGTVLTHP